MIKIRLDGNYCSGKTTIAKIFNEIYIPTFDSDIYHNEYQTEVIDKWNTFVIENKNKRAVIFENNGLFTNEIEFDKTILVSTSKQNIIERQLNVDEHIIESDSINFTNEKQYGNRNAYQIYNEKNYSLVIDNNDELYYNREYIKQTLVEFLTINEKRNY